MEKMRPLHYANYFISVHHFTNEAAHLSKTPDELKVLNNIKNRSPFLFCVLKNYAEMTARNVNINTFPGMRFETIRTLKNTTKVTPTDRVLGELFSHAETMFAWSENSPYHLTYRNFALNNKPDFAIPRLFDSQAELYEERLPLVSVLYRPQHPTPDQDSWIVFLPTPPTTYYLQFPDQVEFNHLEEYGLLCDWERFQPRRFEPNALFPTHEKYAFWQWLNVPDSIAPINRYIETLLGFNQVNIEVIDHYQTSPKAKPTELKANCPKLAWHMLHPLFNQVLHPLPYEHHNLAYGYFDPDWTKALQEANYADEALWLIIADDLDEKNLFPELSNLIRFFCTQKENWR